MIGLWSWKLMEINRRFLKIDYGIPNMTPTLDWHQNKQFFSGLSWNSLTIQI